MVRMIAQVADVVALVVPHDLQRIECWRAEHDGGRMTFVPVQMPRLGRFAQSASFFQEKLVWLSYITWLREARREARRLEAAQPFDVAVHASYGTYWLPSPVVDLAAPSLWGPVGGATKTPGCLWRFLGLRGIVGEVWKRATVRAGTMLPSTQRTWRRATLRLAESEETRDALPAALRKDTRIVNRAVLQEVPVLGFTKRESYLLFPSSLQPRKGARLALVALAQTPSDVRLRFVADGYQRRSLERLADRLGVRDRVEFLGRVPRRDMLRMMQAAAGVVLTGLREEGGCALSEAMQLGAPVIVLAHGGAGLIASANVDSSRVALIETGSAKHTVKRLASAMTEFVRSSPRSRSAYLDRSSTEAAITQALADTISMGKHRG